MTNITLQEIQRNPIAFVQLLEAGEVIVVTRDEHPFAEVRPLVESHRLPRPYGLCAGSFTLPPDFNNPLPNDVIEAFEGR